MISAAMTRPRPLARCSSVCVRRLEHERELGANLRLLVRREDVDDTVDRLGGGVGMERGERQVPRLRDGERRLNRLEIRAFRRQHDVRVLAQRILSAAWKLLVSVPTSRWLTMHA